MPPTVVTAGSLANYVLGRYAPSVPKTVVPAKAPVNTSIGRTPATATYSPPRTPTGTQTTRGGANLNTVSPAPARQPYSPMPYSPATSNSQPTGRGSAVQRITDAVNTGRVIPTGAYDPYASGGGWTDYGSGGYGGSGWVDYGSGSGWIDYGSGGYGSGGYGGGGGGSGPSGTSGGGFGIGELTEPLTGYARRYLPANIMEVAQNPGIVARDIVGDLGYDDGDPLSNLMSRTMGFYGAQILPLLYANMKLGSMPHAGDVVNRLAEFGQDQTRQGGSTVNVPELLKIVLGEASKGTGGQQTMMSALFGGQTASDQARNMSGIVGDISNWAPNPMFGQALRQWIAVQAEEFQRASAQANNPYRGGFGNYLSQGPTASIIPE